MSSGEAGSRNSQEIAEVERIYRESVTDDYQVWNVARQLQLMRIAYHQGFNKGKYCQPVPTELTAEEAKHHVLCLAEYCAEGGVDGGCKLCNSFENKIERIAEASHE